jgi:membrane associated rhomboid family serine protease
MAGNAKDMILKRVREEGHTDSYGMLLYMVAVMGFDPMTLGPHSPVELTSWSGHLDGLRASLLCLAMYERKLGPEGAAEVVDTHIMDALDRLHPGNNPGSGG